MFSPKMDCTSDLIMGAYRLMVVYIGMEQLPSGSICLVFWL